MGLKKMGSPVPKFSPGDTGGVVNRDFSSPYASISRNTESGGRFRINSVIKTSSHNQNGASKANDALSSSWNIVQ